MKIAQLGARSVPARHGGLEVVVESLARELANLGHDVTVYVGEDGPAIDGVRIARSPSVRGKYTHTVSQLLGNIAAVSRSDYDIIHIHGVGPAFVLLLHPFLRWRGKTVVTAHGLDWERAKWPTMAATIFRHVSRRALRRASSISAVSVSTADALARNIQKDVSVIENGLTLPELPDEVELDLPDRFCVSMSRLTPEKNIERVIGSYTDRVAAELGPLVIIGSGAGSYAVEYEESLRSLNNPHVVWLGPLARADALAVVRKAVGYVSMSKLEAQPMAVLEAIALGKRVVLSDIPPHREIAREDAIYADPDSERAVETALLKLAATDAEKDISTAPSARNWAEIATEYEAWYYNALRQVARR